MEKIIIQLQESLCHQGEDIARLSDELYAHQKEMAALKAEISALKKEVATSKDRSEEGVLEDDPHQRPPHY